MRRISEKIAPAIFARIPNSLPIESLGLQKQLMNGKMQLLYGGLPVDVVSTLD